MHNNFIKSQGTPQILSQKAKSVKEKNPTQFTRSFVEENPRMQNQPPSTTINNNNIVININKNYSVNSIFHVLE